VLGSYRHHLQCRVTAGVCSSGVMAWQLALLPSTNQFRATSAAGRWLHVHQRICSGDRAVVPGVPFLARA
jgi:hypothetical protein